MFGGMLVRSANSANITDIIDLPQVKLILIILLCYNNGMESEQRVTDSQGEKRFSA